jgi:hypothetical protein
MAYLRLNGKLILSSGPANQSDTRRMEFLPSTGANRGEVDGDDLVDEGTLHLDDDICNATTRFTQLRTVHLPERGGSQRLGFERGEEGVERATQLCFASARMAGYFPRAPRPAIVPVRS